MAADQESLNLDLAELRHLESVAKRPRVLSLLAAEIRSLDAQLSKAPAPAPAPAPATASVPPPLSVQKAPAVAAVSYVPLSSFSWDQDNDKIKIYVFLDGVEEEKVETVFKPLSVDIKFHDVQGKNYRCAIPKLNKEILPDKSKVLVKPNKVIITLFKASKGNWVDLHFKEDKMSTPLTNDKVKEKFHVCRAIWTDQMKKIFLDLCIEQATTTERPCAKFKSLTWTTIVNKFRKGTGYGYKQKQLKNQLDLMKRQYNAWIALCSETGIKRNEATHSVTMEPDKWVEYLKIHPAGKLFRHKPLKFADEMEAVFSDTSLTGAKSSTLSVGSLPEDVTYNDHVEDAISSEDTNSFDEPAQPRLEALEEMSTPMANETSREKIHACRAMWTEPMKKFFLDLCVEQATTMGRPCEKFKSPTWTTIVDKFRKGTGFGYKQKQLKNQLDLMKRQYNAWIALCSEPGIQRNGATHAVTMQPEKWVEYLKIHPAGKLFRHKPLQFADEMEAVFGGTFTGAKSLTLSIESLPEDVTYNDHVEDGLSSEDANSSDELTQPRLEALEEVGSNECIKTIGRKRPRPSKCRMAERGAVVENQIDAHISLVDVEKPDENVIVPSISECIASLRTIKEISSTSEQFMCALRSFRVKEDREIWMALPEKEARIAWLNDLHEREGRFKL